MLYTLDSSWSSISILRLLYAPRGSLLNVAHACAPLRSKACASEMLFALLIVDENLAVLAIATRLVLGGPDGGEDVLCFLEDGVHLLK